MHESVRWLLLCSNGFLSVSEVFLHLKQKNRLTYIYISHTVHIETYLWEVSELEIDEKKTSTVFKAFCDENRIRILKLLISGEKCACELNEKVDISQPTMSHHMKILCDSGVVAGRKEGKWTYYSISPEGASFAIQTLHALTDKMLPE